MKTKTLRPTTAVILASLLLSCPVCMTSCNTPAGNQALAVIGTGASIAGGFIDGDAGRAITTVGAIVAFVATQQQIAQAQATANEALRRSSVRNAVKRSNSKYVAVPVKRDRSNTKQASSKSSNLIVLVDAETGKPQGKAFEPSQKSYRAGEEIKVPGTFPGTSTKAIVGTSFAGI